jgi:hypothetical protein
MGGKGGLYDQFEDPFHDGLRFRSRYMASPSGSAHIALRSCRVQSFMLWKVVVIRRCVLRLLRGVFQRWSFPCSPSVDHFINLIYSLYLKLKYAYPRYFPKKLFFLFTP